MIRRSHQWKGFDELSVLATSSKHVRVQDAAWHRLIEHADSSEQKWVRLTNLMVANAEGIRSGVLRHFLKECADHYQVRQVGGQELPHARKAARCGKLSDVRTVCAMKTVIVSAYMAETPITRDVEKWIEHFGALPHVVCQRGERWHPRGMYFGKSIHSYRVGENSK